MSVSTANYTKLKTNLRLCIQRLKLLEKKKTELAQKSRKEIADYISQGKAERAKIRVEHIIREDYMVEAMEIVEMYCDTLLARFGMIEQLKTLDEGIEEAVSSLIWVAPRMQSDIKELKVVHDILMLKYGKPYALAARENQLKTVNEKLMIKMGVQAPPKILVERYLIEIAKTLNVHYEPDEDIIREDDLYRKGGPGGGGDFKVDHTGLPPPPGPAGPLIDLENMTQPSGMVLPPPLPTVPPSGPYGSNSAPEGAVDAGAVGFNLDGLSLHSAASSEKSALANQPVLPPSAPAGAMSIPPSYESVISARGQGPAVGGPPGAGPPGQIPSDFDESQLPCIPNLPDIPSDDEDMKKGGGGGASGPGAGNKKEDFDFDDLRRRFDELKKKKF